MSGIDPDLAGKVLTANLRNIVKKIGEGGTLTTAEKEMMEKAKSEQLLADELIRARRAALIRKYTQGHRLNSDEQAEIAAMVPATAAAVKRVTTATYKKTLREYADELLKAGMPECKDKVRKLKYWVKMGRVDESGQLRDEPDMPPFDDLKEMASWWRRVMTYKPPDFILGLERDAAEKATPKQQASDPVAANSKTPVPEDIIPSYREIQLDEDVANDLGVRVAYGLAVDSLRRFEEARVGQNHRLARAIREELREDLSSLRQEQVAALKVLEGKGDYLRAKEIMQEVNRLLAMLDTSFFNSLEEAVRRANPKLSQEERRDLSLELRDRCFEHLHQTRFAEAWTPGLAS